MTQKSLAGHMYEILKAAQSIGGGTQSSALARLFSCQETDAKLLEYIVYINRRFDELESICNKIDAPPEFIDACLTASKKVRQIFQINTWTNPWDSVKSGNLNPSDVMAIFSLDAFMRRDFSFSDLTKDQINNYIKEFDSIRKDIEKSTINIQIKERVLYFLDSILLALRSYNIFGAAYLEEKLVLGAAVTISASKSSKNEDDKGKMQRFLDAIAGVAKAMSSIQSIAQSFSGIGQLFGPQQP